MQGPIRFVLFFAILYPLFTASLSGQTPCDSIYWSTDPATNLNISPWGQNPKTCSDGEGGAFVMWNANTPFTPQFLQYVNRCGEIMWNQPVEIWGNAPGTSYFPAITEDGFGGALIAYTEHDFDGFDFIDDRVRLNRVDRQGNLLWGPIGVKAIEKEVDQYDRSYVAADGQGGAFVSVAFEPDSLFVQHISATGDRLWGENGIFVGNTSHTLEHHLISDTQSGVIVEWATLGPQIPFFKRLNAQGQILWMDTLSTNHYYPFLKPDGYGGVVMAGKQFLPGGKRNIIANAISAEGIFTWGIEGIMVGDTINHFSGISDIVLLPDTSLVIYWTKVNDPVNDYDIFTQFISKDGIVQFPESIHISNVNSLKGGGSVKNSESSSLIFTWTDRRDNTKGFYAQKLDKTGQQLWQVNDVVIRTDDYSQNTVISDTKAGIITVFADAPLNGIFIQQLSKNGNLGEVLDSLPMSIPPLTKPSKTFTLFQNYPNPFNASTNIRFYLSSSEQVELKIFDILGREIRTLLNQKFPAGKHEVIWHGINSNHPPVESGIYIYQLKTQSFIERKKMLLIQ